VLACWVIELVSLVGIVAVLRSGISWRNVVPGGSTRCQTWINVALGHALTRKGNGFERPETGCWISGIAHEEGGPHPQPLSLPRERGASTVPEADGEAEGRETHVAIQ